MEENQWIITRIDKTFDFYFNHFKKKEQALELFVKNQISSYTKIRNGILAIVAFLTTLLIGLHSIEIYFVNTASGISALLFIGFATYFITLIFEQKIQSILEIIEEESTKGHAELYCVLAYFNRRTMDISAHTKDEYLQFLNFLVYHIATALDLKEYFIIKEKLSSKINVFFLSVPITNHLNDILLDDKMSIDASAKDFELNKNTFENISLVEDFLPFGNALLDFQKGKQTDPLAELDE